MMGQIADDIVDGLCCNCCGIYFKKEHGYPVVCKSCYEDLTDEERVGIQKACIEEV